MGWSGKRNGELLQLMIGQSFEVLLTVDRGIRHQQNLTSAGVAMIVLVAQTNRLADLIPLMPSVRTALSSISPGQLVEITA